MASSAAAGPAESDGGRPSLFARQSSGLLRELSFADTAWYGVFSSGGLFAFVFLFPGPQFFSPGISIPLMLVDRKSTRLNSSH